MIFLFVVSYIIQVSKKTNLNFYLSLNFNSRHFCFTKHADFKYENRQFYDRFFHKISLFEGLCIYKDLYLRSWLITDELEVNETINSLLRKIQTLLSPLHI